MPRFIPMSIEKEGLEAFLNAKADQHNGLGFREFDIMVKANVNMANLARAFNVSRPTIEKWMSYLPKPAV